MSGRWTDKLGGRKFIVAVLALVAVTFFIDVTGETKLAFIGTILGLFSAVNASQKAADTASDAAAKLAGDASKAASTVVEHATEAAVELASDVKPKGRK